MNANPAPRDPPDDPSHDLSRDPADSDASPAGNRRGDLTQYSSRIIWWIDQAGHRLLSLAIWLFAARLAMAFVSVDPEVPAELLRWALYTLAAGLVFALGAYAYRRWLAPGPPAADPLDRGVVL